MSIDKKSSYYDAGGIETLAIIKAKLTPEQFAGFLLGNIIKYSTRANFKGQADRDLEKVSVYSAQLNALLASQATPDIDVQTVGGTIVATGMVAPDDTESSNGAQPVPQNVTPMKKPVKPNHTPNKNRPEPEGDLLA